MSNMKKIAAALVAAGSLLAVEAHAAKLTDNTFTLGISSRDSDTGFMIGGEGRPIGTTGLAFSGDYFREDFGP